MKQIFFLFFLKTTLVTCADISAATDQVKGYIKNGNTNSACPIRLKPSESCGDAEECPYQVTLPPMTIQLPKQFRLLEKTIKEVRSLKETVNKMKISCLECKQQADANTQQDSTEQEVNDSGAPPASDKKVDTKVKELQDKLNKVSNSLKNARNQINVLQGRLEEMSLLNINNVENYVDSKVANLTSVVDSLENRCCSNCAAVQPPAVGIMAPKDCSDYYTLGENISGIYRVTPDPINSSFEVYCDMEVMGGGWTVLQVRQDGSINFNKTWKEYKRGFGNLTGEFWLGNDKIHISNEFLRYRLTISGYSGTAGDSLHYNKHYNHDQKYFSTPDRDNDKYPSGNCGAYYSSGWWFDACMSSNLNGKYYHHNYKGVRNGIFWGTWHNVPDEHLSSYRQAFKTVRMLIRPKSFVP
uniref:Fibrinogen like 2 n=1 Tax=Latimeria chalumnae TaxID=7897 RepID=H3A3W7_LATCH